MRAILLVLLPLALLAQPGTIIVGLNDTALRGSTSMIIRGGGSGDQQSCSDCLTTPEPLRVWKATDGSKWVWVKGEPHRISFPPPRIEWRDYLAYGAAVTADYATTRSALDRGATELIYACSPARPGCMNTKLFTAVSLLPLGQWAFYDVWGRHHVSPRWQRFQAGSRKTNILFRVGVSIWNLSQ